MKTFKLIYEDNAGKTIVEIFTDKKEAQQLVKKLSINNNIKIISKNF